MEAASASKDLTFDEVLDELCMRFINNLPPSEYESFERLFFAVEAAHWFYDDFHREENRSLPKLNLKSFAAKIFQHSPLLRPHAKDVHKLASQFQTYKFEVPTCGAAMLNPDMTKVLLVCGWGKNGKWGFPKGKIGKDETELEAAVREVYEETGYDFATILEPDPEDDTLLVEPYFIDSFGGGKLSRIFVVPGVPEDTVFETQTRKEISAIRWVPIANLPEPGNKTSLPAPTMASKPGVSQSGSGDTFKPKQFWLVSQYVPKLKSFIKRRRKGAFGASSRTEKVPAASNTTQTQAGFGNGAGPTVTLNGNGVEGNKKNGKQIKSSQRQRASTAAERDSATFGAAALQTPSGSKAMTPSERKSFFRSYVAEADKRKAEMGIGDDFWPVKFITSKDLGVEPAPVSMKAACGDNSSRLPKLRETSAAHRDGEQVLTGLKSFAFKKESVLSHLA